VDGARVPTRHTMKDKRCGLAIYEHAAGVLARVEEGAGMRTALYEHQMPNAVRPSVLALVCETLKSKERLETALKETTINTGLSTNDRCMTLVLTFELAVRGGTIKGGAKSALVRAVFEQKAALIALLGGPGPVAPAAPRQKLPRYVRVNTLRTSVEAALEHLEKEDGLQRLDGLAAPDEAAAAPLWRKGAVLADPLLPSLLVLPPGTNLHGHPLVERGELILQDRASCLPAWALSPPEGAKVIGAPYVVQHDAPTM
jgi:putative methyltransferase